MTYLEFAATSSNSTPLGSRRRLPTADSRADVSPTQGSPVNDGQPSSRRGNHPGERLRTIPESNEASPSAEGAGPKKKRKRGNRWEEGMNSVAGLVGLPTAILTTMTSEQLDAYAVHLRIEEITQKLKINDIIPPDRLRSPSPPPTYDGMGRRNNTRENRYRKRLEAERHNLIQEATSVIPNYRVPADYRRPTKSSQKVYVPVNDYPEVNFIGQLIGPRGNTLKKMEIDSGAKIAIRGRGSVKEGKGGSDRATDSNLEEDLHCLIIGSEEAIAKGVKLVNDVIETAASVPEVDNAHKRKQLRDLATLNGTLRDDENQACQNCGEIGHRKYDCPQQRNYTSSVTCRLCGNLGHFARECLDRKKGQDWRAGPESRDFVDREYEQLMQELEGGHSSGGAIGTTGTPALIEDNTYESGGEPTKPWRGGPTGAQAPWKQLDQPRPWSNGTAGKEFRSDGRQDGQPFSRQTPWNQQTGGYGAPQYGTTTSSSNSWMPPNMAGAPSNTAYSQCEGGQTHPWNSQAPGQNYNPYNNASQALQYDNLAPPPPPPPMEAPPPPPPPPPPPSPPAKKSRYV